MRCINEKCKSTTTRVAETNTTLNVIYRRRCCPDCGKKYTTIEVLAPDQTMPNKQKAGK